jgi:hypothetical protein
MMPIDGQVMLEIAPRFSGTKGARQAEISPMLASMLASYGNQYAIEDCPLPRADLP